MPSGDKFRFVMADINGVELAEVPAGNPTWSYVLNDAGACSFVLPVRHPLCNRQLFKLNQSELHIYYNTNLVWGGHLYNVDGNAVGDIRFGFEGYWARVKRRYIDVTKKYTSTDADNIAWDLINWTQTKTDGALGMGWTRNTTVHGVNRDVTFPFWERVTVADAILGLAELGNGFDFEVTANKVWQTYHPSKGAVKDIPMEWGKNISTFALTEDGTDTANTYSAIGAGDGKNTCIAVGSSPANIAIYGLLEMAESYTEIKHYSRLQDKATEMVRMKKAPRLQPSVTLDPTMEPTNPFYYGVADRCQVICGEGYFNFNQQMRIISQVFALSNEGRPAVTYQFDEETDV